MNIQPSTGKRSGLIRILATPLSSPMMKGAEKLGDLAQGGVLSAVKKFGVDGGGGKIANYAGIAAENAARAVVGGGTLRNGGRGIAGGNSRLELAGHVVAGLAAAAFIAAAVVGDERLSKRSEQSAPTSRCKNCQGALADSEGEGDTSHANATCHRCGHENTGQA